MRRPRTATIFRVIAVVVMLTTTAALYGSVPQRTESYAPLTVRATAPGTGRGENIVVTVHHVYSTPKLAVGTALPMTQFKLATSQWIVIDASYSTVHTFSRLKGSLQADARTVDIDPEVSGVPFGSPGMPKSFAMAFNLQEPPRTLSFRAGNTPELSLDEGGNPIDDVFKIVEPAIVAQLDFDIDMAAVERRSFVQMDGGRVIYP